MASKSGANPRESARVHSESAIKPERNARLKLSSIDIARIRIETFVAESTIRVWAAGGKVTPRNDHVLRRAAEKLGLIVGS